VRVEQSLLLGEAPAQAEGAVERRRVADTIGAASTCTSASPSRANNRHIWCAGVPLRTPSAWKRRTRRASSWSGTSTTCVP
jgi:hypothetical protein